MPKDYVSESPNDITIWEENVADNLGSLASGDITVRSEVGPIVGGHARLAKSFTCIALHDQSAGQTLRIRVERGTRRHILERLPNR